MHIYLTYVTAVKLHSRLASELSLLQSALHLQSISADGGLLLAFRNAAQFLASLFLWYLFNYIPQCNGLQLLAQENVWDLFHSSKFRFLSLNFALSFYFKTAAQTKLDPTLRCASISCLHYFSLFWTAYSSIVKGFVVTRVGSILASVQQCSPYF